MRNIDLKRFQNAGLASMTALLLLVILIAFFTYNNTHWAEESAIVSLAVKHHVWIMLFLVVLSVSYGVLWSKISISAITRKNKNNEGMLAVLFKFLSSEERAIIDYLYEHDGQTTQHELARLPKMNNVKAYRTAQRLQQKDVVQIIAHGKTRIIRLKKDIMLTLRDVT